MSNNYKIELVGQLTNIKDPQEAAGYLYDAMCQWMGPDHKQQCVDNVLYPALKYLMKEGAPQGSDAQR